EVRLADAVDRAFDAQGFGLAEEVAVAPVALEAEAVRVGILRADAEIAVLAFRDLDGHRQRAVRGEAAGLADRHAGEDAELAQALGRLGERFRRIGLTGIDARIALYEIRIHRLGTRYADRADGRDRPALGGDHHV